MIKYILIVCTVLLIFVNYSKNEFVDCIGPCILLKNCRRAKIALKENRTHPEICGFKDGEPFVCCGIDDEKTLYEIHLANARPSEKKCKEFYPPFVPPSYDYSGPLTAVPAASYGFLTEWNEFPFMATLGYGDIKNPAYICGGFLIDKNVVITAAHCAKISGEAPVVVRIGSYPLTYNGTKPIKIAKIISHPNYANDTNLNDIAIIFLSANSFEQPACLWTNTLDLNPEKWESRAIAVGYGTTSFAGPFSKDPIKVYMNLLENEICKKEYKDLPIKNSQLCVLGEKRVYENKTSGIQDTCQGDSGGPLILYYNSTYVAGITSFGRRCGSEVPGVYTNISWYLDWIESVIWPEDTKERVFIV